MSIKRTLKEKFGYDVSDLENWKDNTLPNITADLVETSDFLSELTLEEGVKGTTQIGLLSANISLQAKANCTPSPDGSVILTGVDLTTKPLYMGIEFCNEDLNKKMTQVLNALGMKMQEGQLPAPLDTILQAYLTKVGQKKANRIVWLGDTTSLDPDLLHFDGLVKILDNHADVLETPSIFATIDDTNGYDAVKELYKTIPAEVFDAQMPINIYTGRTEALAILEQYNNSHPYTQVTPTEIGGTLTFKIPTTGVTVKTNPALNGLNRMYAVVLPLTFLGTDQREDETFEMKYDNYREKLKAEASFRLGTNIVWGQYFVRLRKA